MFQLDKYDLRGDGYNGEGILSVLEYQQNKRVQRRSFNNIYVKNFSKDSSFTDEQLAELFKVYGDVTSASVMRDQEGNSKGFGFVCFTEASAAEKATEAINLTQAEEGENEATRLFACEAKKKEDRCQQLQINNFKYKKSIMFFSLFVKNFPPGTTDDELKIFFTSACNGEVTKVQIIPGTQQAFVNFEKQDCCKQAKEFARNVLFKSQYALYAEYCYPKEMRLLRNEDILDKRAMERRKN